MWSTPHYGRWTFRHDYPPHDERMIGTRCKGSDRTWILDDFGPLILYDTLWYFMILYDTLWYFMILYDTLYLPTFSTNDGFHSYVRLRILAAQAEPLDLATLDLHLCTADTTTCLSGWLDLFLHLLDAHRLAHGTRRGGCGDVNLWITYRSHTYIYI